MLEAVCSGGQIGADIAGLRAAKKCGLETYGVMPKGFKTRIGPKPKWAEEFNLVEHPSDNYAIRTRANVRASDGTIRLALSFDSPGERCTLRELRKANKPYLDVPLAQTGKKLTPRVVAAWIIEYDITELNIAGNANRLIEQYVERFLIQTFKQVKVLANDD